MKTLQEHFTERELKEIEFCRLYADKFNHGTSGHILRIIVSKMAGLLGQCYYAGDVEPMMQAE